MKKLSYLFLALLVPSLIFIFLKFAGKNKFDVPVYFEQGVAEVAEHCVRPSGTPRSQETGAYHLPDSLWLDNGLIRKEANVFIFPARGIDTRVVQAALDDELGNGSVLVVDANSIVADSLELNNCRRCVFMVKEPTQAVLADGAGRIRGYYDLHARDEMDRMRVEIKIVLQRY